MRVPVEYVALAISGLGLSSSGAQAPLFEVSSLESTAASKCWAPSSMVNANYGPLSDLRLNANVFCQKFSSNSTAIVAGSGMWVFGWQSAMFVGTFASWTTCLNTFNTLVTDCYGTANPQRPTTLGGTIIDSGGANLVISFGDGAQL